MRLARIMATLTVTLTEAVSLGDGSTDRGTTNIQTISNIDEVDHRIMDIPTSWVDIIKFDAANSAGTFADGTVKYLRITNLGATNYVNLRIRTAASEYFVKVELEDIVIQLPIIFESYWESISARTCESCGEIQEPIDK